MDYEQEPILNHDKTERRILTMAERVNVIKVYKGMANKSRYVEELSLMFSCGRSQIRKIIKDKDDILKEWDDSCKHNPFRVRRKTPPEVVALGKILSEWVVRCLRKKHNLNTAQIRHAATKITKILDFPKFRPTNRWLDRFLKKYRFIDIKSREQFDPKTFALIDVKIEDIIVDVQHKLPTEVEEQINKLLSLNMCNRYKSNYSKAQPGAKKKIEIGHVLNVEQNHEIRLNVDFDQILEYAAHNGNDETPMLSASVFEGGDASNPIKMDRDAYENDLPTVNIRTVLENTPECPIKTLEDAIKYLKPLEEYTLLTSNYRAINFVACLENLFHAQNNTADKNKYKLKTE